MKTHYDCFIGKNDLGFENTVYMNEYIYFC